MTLFPLLFLCRRVRLLLRLLRAASSTAAACALLLPALTLASGAQAAGTPAGMLWHNDFALDLHRGVQVSPLDGSAPVPITNRSNGSRFEQLTQARAIGSALWSPDGRYVAYTVDTGGLCNGQGCLRDCDQHYTRTTLRQVRGFDGTPGGERFEVSNRRGQRHRLGCAVLAWTR